MSLTEDLDYFTCRFCKRIYHNKIYDANHDCCERCLESTRVQKEIKKEMEENQDV